MKKVCISDRTLTETNRAVQNPLSFKEKIEIARLLSNLHVDAIELPPLKNVRTVPYSSVQFPRLSRTARSHFRPA